MEQARRQLQEREQQFGELMRILPDGVMLIAAGRVLYANPACAAQFGLGADDLPGQPLATLVENAGLAALRALLDGADAAAAAPRMRRADGSLFNAALSACDARYAGQACKLLIVRDLSEPERMRDALALGNRELQALAGRLFSLQEDERRAISRELHDDIGQSITAIKLSASAALDEADPERRREDLAGIIELADATLDKLRDISTLLRPPQLDALGLEAALRGHVLQLFRNGATGVELQIEPLPRRPAREVEQACFRIAQEALTNVLRHSHARVAQVVLHDRGGAIALEVQDDGNGFEQARARGLGLVIMRERAQTVGGSLAIDSSAAGTRVSALLPYAPAQPDQAAAHPGGR